MSNNNSGNKIVNAGKLKGNNVISPIVILEALKHFLKMLILSMAII